MNLPSNLSVYLYRELAKPPKKKVLRTAKEELVAGGMSQRDSRLRSVPPFFRLSLTKGSHLSSGNTDAEIKGLSEDKLLELFLAIASEAEFRRDTIRTSLSLNTFRLAYEKDMIARLIPNNENGMEVISDERDAIVAIMRSLGHIDGETTGIYTPGVMLGEVKDNGRVIIGRPREYELGPLRAHISSPESSLRISGTLGSVAHSLDAIRRV